MFDARLGSKSSKREAIGYCRRISKSSIDLQSAFIALINDVTIIDWKASVIVRDLLDFERFKKEKKY